MGDNEIVSRKCVKSHGNQFDFILDVRLVSRCIQYLLDKCFLNLQCMGMEIYGFLICMSILALQWILLSQIACQLNKISLVVCDALCFKLLEAWKCFASYNQSISRTSKCMCIKMLINFWFYAIKEVQFKVLSTGITPCIDIRFTTG